MTEVRQNFEAHLEGKELTPEAREKVIDLLHELAEAKNAPDPKDIANIKRIKDELRQHDIDSESVPAAVAVKKDDGHGHGHGHKPKTRREVIKDFAVSASTISGGIVAGMLGWFTDKISEWATGQKSSGGGGGKGGHGGGGHGGGGHH